MSENQSPKTLLCPHCRAYLDNVETRRYGDDGSIVVIGCSKCFVAIGANVGAPPEPPKE